MPQHDADASLRKLLDDCPDPIAVHRNNAIVYVNPAGLKLLGYQTEADVLGRSPLDFVSPTYREIAGKRMFKSYASGGATPEIEERFVDAQGNEVAVEVMGVPLRFDGERATLVHIRDIRARKELEGKLAAADRLASVGMVTAALVHQLDGPLASVADDVDLLERRLDVIVPAAHLREVRAICNDVQDGLRGVLDVMRDVRIFADAATGRSPIDVNAILDSVTKLLAFELRGRAHLVKQYGHVPTVSGSPARLGHVFASILMDAVRATPPPQERSNEVTIATYARGDDVVVEIRDTGRVADATGLGLEVSKTMLQDVGGSIAVEDDETGSTFVVTLPAAPREPEAVTRP